MLSQIQWQKIPTFLDKKCPRRGFGRFPYLWKISLLRMFWQPSHLSYISFGNLWCQYIFFLNSVPKKNSPRLYSPQFGTFYAWQSCARWKRQMLCKNNISFSFLCQLYVAGKSFDDGEETNLFFLIVQTLLCAADFCIFTIFFWTNLVYFFSLTVDTMVKAKVFDKVFGFKRYHRNNERWWKGMLNLKEAATFTSTLLKGKCCVLLSIHSLITFCVPQSKSKTHYHPFYAAKLHVKRKYVRANVQQNCLLKMICRRSCEEKLHVIDVREN